MKFIFLLLFVFSCGSVPKKEESKVVDQFLASWTQDYGKLDPIQETAFRSYLKNIEKFYHDHGKDDKFPGYLSSINNKQQLIAHLENNLPARFQKRYRSWPVRKSPNYLRYQKQETSDLRNRLETARLERLKFDLGESFFEELKTYSATVDRQGQDLGLTL